MRALPTIELYPSGSLQAASARLRGIGLARELQRLGCAVSLGLDSAALPDVLVVQKTSSPEIVARARAVRAQGGQVIFDIDDWGDALPWAVRDPALLADLLAECAAVAVDTPQRADVLRQDPAYAGIADFWVVPDPVDYVDGALPATAVAPITSAGTARLAGCWFGNGPNLAPALPLVQAALATDRLRRFAVITNAQFVPQLQQALPMLAVEAWQLDSFAGRLRDHDFCLLVHDTHTEGLQKSNNKMLAALGQGVVPLVSNTPAYAETARRIGIPELVFDSPADLARRIEPGQIAALRQRIQGEACQQLLRETMPATVARGFLARVQALRQAAAPAAPAAASAPAAPAAAAPRLACLLDLLSPDHRPAALQQLQADGFIPAGLQAQWAAELALPVYQRRLCNDLLAPLKLRLDAQIEHYGGNLASRKALEILSRLTKLLRQQGAPGWVDHAGLAGRTAVDFGAGIYCPLSVATVLFANGYGRVVALEPFPVQADMATASLLQTLGWLALRPADFNFSGIDAAAMRQRLAGLDFSRLPAQLQALERGDVALADFGGVALGKHPQALADGCADLLFSNSTLEHVQDLAAELAGHRRILKPEGLCVHTVDFSDHRAIGSTLGLFEMYADGVLDHINGLRPSQMERLFVAAGFDGTRIPQLNAPPGTVTDPGLLRPPFNTCSVADLSVWVNSYLLRPVAVLA